MPPKASSSKTNNESDGRAAITALCHLIMSSPDFQGDNAKLAPVLNIAQAKNVPRKINSIINPYGFEYKSSKIFEIGAGDGDDVPPTPPPVTSTASTVNTKQTQTRTGKKTASSTSTNPKAPPKGASGKKRKIIEVEEAEEIKDEDVDVLDADDEHEDSGVVDTIENGTVDED